MASLGSSLAPSLLAGGTVMSAMGYLDAAKATKLMAGRKMAAAQFTAQQLEQNAGQETAAGQLAAAEQERQGKIINSNVLAKAAMSGGASDPTIVNLIARNAGETSYRAALASYQGLAAARQSKIAAQGQIYGGELAGADAETAAGSLQGRALTTSLLGAGSLYSKYWAGPEKGLSMEGGPLGEGIT